MRSDRKTHGTCRRLRAGRRLIVLLLGGALLTGCGGYPKVGPAAFELAKVLYTVCNAENEEQLEEFRDLVKDKHQNGELTDEERSLLLEIADTADAGHWDRAEREARQLLLDQNEA